MLELVEPSFHILYVQQLYPRVLEQDHQQVKVPLNILGNFEGVIIVDSPHDVSLCIRYGEVRLVRVVLQCIEPFGHSSFLLGQQLLFPFGLRLVMRRGSLPLVGLERGGSLQQVVDFMSGHVLLPGELLHDAGLPL